MICSKCKSNTSETTSGGYCKPCQRIYFKEYYTNNKEKHIKAVTKSKFTFKYRIAKYKVDKGCYECGYNKHYAALHFHHLDATQKEFLVSAANVSHDKILEEIEKCVVLCANCHAIHHCKRELNDLKNIKSFKQQTNKKKGLVQKTTPKNFTGKIKQEDITKIKKLVWEIPSEEIAKQYGVSGSYLSRFCKLNNIEKPPRGYWAKIYKEQDVYS